MNKLPEVLIGKILSFLYKPSDCIIKGYNQFLVIDKLTNQLSKKIMSKCHIDNVLNRNICKAHCKAYPLYKKIDNELKRQKNHEYLHFKQHAVARLALRLFPEKFSTTCCYGKGLRQKRSKRRRRFKKKIKKKPRKFY